jgi:hypothetical protein
VIGASHFLFQDAGRADVLVRTLSAARCGSRRRSALQFSRFALIADEDVRAPSACERHLEQARIAMSQFGCEF